MPVWECYRTNACLCLLCSKMDHLMVTTDKYFNCGFAKEYLQSRSQGLLKNIELARQYLTVLKIHFNNSEIILFCFWYFRDFNLLLLYCRERLRSTQKSKGSATPFLEWQLNAFRWVKARSDYRDSSATIYQSIVLQLIGILSIFTAMHGISRWSQQNCWSLNEPLPKLILRFDYWKALWRK